MFTLRCLFPPRSGPVGSQSRSAQRYFSSKPSWNTINLFDKNIFFCHGPELRCDNNTFNLILVWNPFYSSFISEQRGHIHQSESIRKIWLQLHERMPVPSTAVKILIYHGIWMHPFFFVSPHLKVNFDPILLLQWIFFIFSIFLAIEMNRFAIEVYGAHVLHRIIILGRIWEKNLVAKHPRFFSFKERKIDDEHIVPCQYCFELRSIKQGGWKKNGFHRIIWV